MTRIARIDTDFLIASFKRAHISLYPYDFIYFDYQNYKLGTIKKKRLIYPTETNIFPSSLGVFEAQNFFERRFLWTKE